MFASVTFAAFAPRPALFGPVGWSELLIILFLVLLFFGPKRLPELAEAIGKSIARFKKASQQMKDEIESEKKKPEPTEGKDKQG
jgi:sec-independent protein translocase protein TatA